MTAPPMDPTQQPLDPALSGGVLHATTRELFGPDAQGVGANGESQANQIAAPNPPEDDDREPLDRLRALMISLYGSDFPLARALDAVLVENPQYAAERTMPPLDVLLKETETDEWCSWVRGRWALHRAAVEMHLYLVARNRLFRAGQQWVSSSKGGSWREPVRPTESARVCNNLIAPALDQRIQVITDQRPGFQVDPSNRSPEEKRKAEGRQQALEFQYDGQSMDRETREAAYWAGTDGVAFWETFWDRDAGPWDERMGNAPGDRKPMGDLRTKTRRCEQVRVSANATATEAPYYVIVRDVLSETESAYLYGVAGVVERATDGNDLSGSGSADTSGTGADGIMPSWVLTQTIVGEGNRLNNMRTVERFTMYVDKHPDILPEGLQLVVVGNALVWGPGELLFGVIPIARITDGSSDPSYFPRPIMESWIPSQQRVNAALSLWVNSVRVNAGGRFLARPDAISRETFVGSGLSIIEVAGAGPLGDQILPVNGFLVGQDVKDLIAFDVKAFEDQSGYNAVSRGEVSTETATAVAAANEQIERIFRPPAEAVARGFTDWSKINLAGMAWGYDLPRDLGTVGGERSDLARALSSKDFDGPASVKVEAEKLIPMPKVYRLQILDDWFNRGLITAQQYMRNAKFPSLSDLTSPDEDQTARAKRVADMLRLQSPPEQVPPIRWQDNESIHQDVLERELLLQDDLPLDVIQAADDRWKALAAQAQQKQGVLQPPAGPAAPTGAPDAAPTAPPGPIDPHSMSAPPAPVPQGPVGAEGQAGAQASSMIA